MPGAGYTAVKLFGIGGRIAWSLWSWTALGWTLALLFIGRVAQLMLFILLYFVHLQRGNDFSSYLKGLCVLKEFYMQSL